MRRGWLLLGLPFLAGCQSKLFSTGFFAGEGALVSSGGGLGAWSARPQACTRDPFLGTAEGDSAIDPRQSVLTLLWEDPSASHYRPDLYRRFSPDVPRRLEIASGPAGFQAMLRTMKRQHGIPLSASACRVFSLETQQEPPAEPHGRPRLAGELKLDCAVQNTALDEDLRDGDPPLPGPVLPSRLTAEIRFRHCGF